MVDSLRNIFDRLELIMIGEAAVRFADAEVLRVLNTFSVYNADGTMTSIQLDSDGLLTHARVAEIQTLSERKDLQYSIFSNNTKIETFNEFKHFTGIEHIGQNMFGGCSNLREITFPVCKTTKLARYLVNDTKVTRFIVPEGYTEIDTIRTGAGDPFTLVDFPSTVQNITGFMWNFGCDVFICRAVTPPPITWGRVSVLNKIYVPDASVDAYKVATGWSDRANLIQPLSAYSK